MLKDNKSPLLIILMAVLLITNWLTWTNTRELEERLNQLQGQLHNIPSQISGEVSGIRHIVQEMKNDAQWWTPAEVEFLDINQNQAQVKISWNLKEYNANSKVMLTYQLPGKKEYRQIPAEEESKGCFSVILPVDIPLEPYIDVHLERTGPAKNQREEIAVKETRAAGNRDLKLTYYISVQDGEVIRTSEKRSLDLSKLTFKLFNPVDLRVILDESINASIQQYNAGNPQYEIREIYLETRKGQGEVLEKWPFELSERMPEQQEERIVVYDVQATPARDYDSLYVVIKYSGGVSAEKEICM